MTDNDKTSTELARSLAEWAEAEAETATANIDKAQKRMTGTDLWRLTDALTDLATAKARRDAATLLTQGIQHMADSGDTIEDVADDFVARAFEGDSTLFGGSPVTASLKSACDKVWCDMGRTVQRRTVRWRERRRGFTINMPRFNANVGMVLVKLHAADAIPGCTDTVKLDGRTVEGKAARSVMAPNPMPLIRERAGGVQLTPLGLLVAQHIASGEIVPTPVEG